MYRATSVSYTKKQKKTTTRKKRKTFPMKNTYQTKKISVPFEYHTLRSYHKHEEYVFFSYTFEKFISLLFGKEYMEGRKKFFFYSRNRKQMKNEKE